MFRTNLKEFRILLGLDEKELSERVERLATKRGISMVLHWRTLRSVEKEQYKPSLELAILLSEALHVPIDELFEW